MSYDHKRRSRNNRRNQNQKCKNTTVIKNSGNSYVWVDAEANAKAMAKAMAKAINKEDNNKDFDFDFDY